MMTFARIAAIALTVSIAATFAADASAKGKGKRRLYSGSSHTYQQQTTQSSGKYYGTQGSYQQPSFTQSSGKRYGYGSQSGYQLQTTPGKWSSTGNAYHSSHGSSTQYFGGGYQGQHGLQVQGGFPSQNFKPKQRYGQPAPLPHYGY